jgi:hypothetical protein
MERFIVGPGPVDARAILERAESALSSNRNVSNPLYLPRRRLDR